MKNKDFTDNLIKIFGKGRNAILIAVGEIVNQDILDPPPVNIFISSNVTSVVEYDDVIRISNSPLIDNDPTICLPISNIIDELSEMDENKEIELTGLFNYSLSNKVFKVESKNINFYLGPFGQTILLITTSDCISSDIDITDDVSCMKYNRIKEELFNPDNADKNIMLFSETGNTYVTSHVTGVFKSLLTSQFNLYESIVFNAASIKERINNTSTPIKASDAMKIINDAEKEYNKDNFRIVARIADSGVFCDIQDISITNDSIILYL